MSMFDDVLGDSALKVPNSEGQWNAEHCDGTRAGLCGVTNCSGIRLSRTPLRYSTPTLPFPLYSPAIHCVIPSLWKFPTFLHRFTMASIVWGCVLDGIHHQGAERATLSRDLGLGHMLPPATLVMLLACFQRLCHVFFCSDIRFITVNFESALCHATYVNFHPALTGLRFPPYQVFQYMLKHHHIQEDHLVNSSISGWRVCRSSIF